MPANEAELQEITVFLKRLSDGDSTAEAPLAEAVYNHMKRIARQVAGSAGAAYSVQPTMLVNEVLMELVRVRNLQWKDRHHFFRTAARLLRRRFVDHIRKHRAAKRQNDDKRVEFDPFLMPVEARFEEIMIVHEALDQLETFDAGLAELVEMTYFGGVPIAEIAQIRNVSEKTIDRHLELARRWLAKKLGEPCPFLQSGSASQDRR